MMWDGYNSRYRERTMNKAIFATLALATSVAFAGPAFADKYKAALDGKSETPPTTSTGTATAAIDYDAATKKLPTMFPDSIKGMNPGGDYEVSSKIWDDKAGFKARIDGFAKIVTEAKTKITDLDTLKATAPAIGKECGNCHETFRIKKG